MKIKVSNSNEPQWRNIIIKSELPGKLQKLNEMSRNLWWAWNSEGKTLFHDLDRDTWRATSENPVKMLQRLTNDKIEAIKADSAMMARIDSTYEVYKEYMKQPLRNDLPSVAYFCMEYGLCNALKIYSGGLGILAGDYVKEASDRRVNMTAVGFLYRYGYFTQTLAMDGQQIANYEAQNFSQLPIEPVLDENGNETTKPIEDITYSDLVKVWNHETGTIDYQHPARIEKASVKPFYQLATLDDGTTLGTFGWHGVFDVNANEFISVDDSIKFHEGVEIYKVEGDQLVARTVENIEIVNEEVAVYHLLSSQYYNVVANDILTTDGFVLTSNFYGFTEHNIMWPEARNQFIADPNNLYTYADFADIGVPFRMFNDLRLREASYLQRYGITLEMFKQYLVSQGVIEGMVPYDDE